MKKIVLSAVAIATMASFGSASELSDLKAQMKVMADKIAELEAKQEKQAQGSQAKSAGTEIKSKVPVIEIGGKDYLGFVSKDPDSGDRTNKFETRRNYIDLKGFFAENPKDYVRATLDVYQTSGGSWDTKLKYAYLYLDNILPNTGVELGMVHRPWIDYEENNAWLYRSVSKVLVEDSVHGSDFVSSADLGANFKTKTPYFSSEIGLFNGAGYDKVENGAGLSEEWRLTGHLLGTGEAKVTKDLQYANVSFFGQRSQDDFIRGGIDGDFNWYGIHAVYNQPEFLIAGQYVNSTDGAIAYKGRGYEFNGEYRFLPDWSLIGMYTNQKLDSGDKKTGKLIGVAYDLNKNVKLIGNYLKETNPDATKAGDSIMATAEVNW
ncbi:MAG: hypothetical protein PHE73_06070 [Sulfurovaceae bacterium]|nr:hypothetical protein [Sulfurovaceae bacterium]